MNRALPSIVLAVLGLLLSAPRVLAEDLLYRSE